MAPLPDVAFCIRNCKLPEADLISAQPSSKNHSPGFKPDKDMLRLEALNARHAQDVRLRCALSTEYLRLVVIALAVRESDSMLTIAIRRSRYLSNFLHVTSLLHVQLLQLSHVLHTYLSRRGATDIPD